MCKRSFHRECGFKANCQFRFKEPAYESYCERHVQINPIEKTNDGEKCGICQEPIEFISAVSPIKCAKCRSLFHNMCLMNQACRSGNFFKCPLCNDYEDFRDDCKERGVFIPER